MPRRKVKVCAAIVTLALSGSSGDFRATAIACGAEPGGAFVAEFDFVLGERQLTIPCKVGTARYRFGLATSEPTSFGKAFADRLPRLPPALDEPDDSTVVFRSVPDCSAGALDIRFPEMFVRCLLTPAGNRRFLQCEGVIGLDILAQYVVQIDFDQGKIRFARSVPASPGAGYQITSFQRRPRRCAVLVRAKCASAATEEFYVELESYDTIYIRSGLYRKLFENREIHALHQESTFDPMPRTVCRVGTLDTFELGRFCTKDVRAIVNSDNVIGLGYLSRFIVTFDLPNGRMYLRPGRHFDSADGYDSSGLIGSMHRDGFEVLGCRRRSPAFECGLEPHDIILDVDGTPVNVNSQAAFRRQMRQADRTLRVHFRRGSADRTADMELRSRQQGVEYHPPGPEDALLDLIPDIPPRMAPEALSEPEPPGEHKNAA